VPLIRLTLEYDGTGFHGWQVQPGCRTVQGVIEEAVATLIGQAVRVSGAGRTDRGTHALGQVAAVPVPDSWPAARLGAALRAVLPGDVAVIDARAARPDFDPRRDAVRREYRYRLSAHPAALDRSRRWHVRQPLDRAAIRTAASHLVGLHDFTPFTVHADEAPRTELRLEIAEVHDSGEELMMVFAAHHFLNRMVRLMVGTLVDVGRGRFTADAPRRALAEGDRRWVGTAAPAHGLYLVRVDYAEGE